MSVLSKNGSVIKDKEWLWESSRLKEAKETRQLNAVLGPRLAPELQGNALRKNCWANRQHWRMAGCVKRLHFLKWITVLWLYERMSLFLGNTR